MRDTIGNDLFMNDWIRFIDPSGDIYTYQIVTIHELSERCTVREIGTPRKSMWEKHVVLQFPCFNTKITDESELMLIKLEDLT